MRKWKRSASSCPCSASSPRSRLNWLSSRSSPEAANEAHARHHADRGHCRDRSRSRQLPARPARRRFRRQRHVRGTRCLECRRPQGAVLARPDGSGHALRQARQIAVHGHAARARVRRRSRRLRRQGEPDGPAEPRHPDRDGEARRGLVLFRRGGHGAVRRAAQRGRADAGRRLHRAPGGAGADGARAQGPAAGHRVRARLAGAAERAAGARARWRDARPHRRGTRAHARDVDTRVADSTKREGRHRAGPVHARRTGRRRGGRARRARGCGGVARHDAVSHRRPREGLGGGGSAGGPGGAAGARPESEGGAPGRPGTRLRRRAEGDPSSGQREHAHLAGPLRGRQQGGQAHARNAAAAAGGRPGRHAPRRAVRGRHPHGQPCGGHRAQAGRQLRAARGAARRRPGRRRGGGARALRGGPGGGERPVPHRLRGPAEIGSRHDGAGRSRQVIAALIRWSVANRFLVLIATAFLVAAGLWSVKNTAVDALPDLSDTQVIVRTTYPGKPPQVVEDLVTYPLTTTMLSVPGAKTVRGYSFFGDSFVYILFDDRTDPYWARSRVVEYLNQVQGRLPPGATAALGPDATGVGWGYEYALVDRSGTQDLSQLRSLNDWFLRIELKTVPDVS